MCYDRRVGRTLTIRLDEETAKILDEEARRTHRAKGAIVRDALVAHLAPKKPNALQGLAKYAGSIRGPADLSSNKKHLADMGRSRRS